MLKKLRFIVPVVISTLFIGCAMPGGTKTDNTLRGIRLDPHAEAHPMVADLEVSDKKVMGQASGKVLSQGSLEREAIAAALKQTDGDVLVGVSYFYETTKGTDLTVTVMGYPARYRNFRAKEVKNDNKTNVLLKGQFIYEDGSSNNLSVTVNSAAANDVAPKAEAPAVHATPINPAIMNMREE